MLTFILTTIGFLMVLFVLELLFVCIPTVVADAWREKQPPLPAWRVKEKEAEALRAKLNQLARDQKWGC